MKDQATNLRDLIKKRIGTKIRDKKLYTLAVTSGKGGVGKSNIILNLAIALRRFGLSISVLDADFALANIDILLGIRPKHNLSDVLKHKLSFDDIIIKGPENISIIPASSGIQEMSMLSEGQLQTLFDIFSEIEKQSDILLIDTSAGISDNVINLLGASDDILLITLNEPPAIIDAYALCKVLWQHSPAKDFHLIVNQVKKEGEGKYVSNILNGVINRFLVKRVGLLGEIFHDPAVFESVQVQKPFLIHKPFSKVSRSLLLIAKQIVNMYKTHNNKGEKSDIFSLANKQ